MGVLHVAVTGSDTPQTQHRRSWYCSGKIQQCYGVCVFKCNLASAIYSFQNGLGQYNLHTVFICQFGIDSASEIVFGFHNSILTSLSSCVCVWNNRRSPWSYSTKMILIQMFWCLHALKYHSSQRGSWIDFWCVQFRPWRLSILSEPYTFWLRFVLLAVGEKYSNFWPSRLWRSEASAGCVISCNAMFRKAAMLDADPMFTNRSTVLSTGFQKRKTTTAISPPPGWGTLVLCPFVILLFSKTAKVDVFLIFRVIIMTHGTVFEFTFRHTSQNVTDLVMDKNNDNNDNVGLCS